MFTDEVVDYIYAVIQFNGHQLNERKDMKRTNNALN